MDFIIQSTAKTYFIAFKSVDKKLFHWNQNIYTFELDYKDYSPHFPTVCFPDPEPDYNWNLMKLMTSFPGCDKDFLQDILKQCNGDYEEACTLLISTLSWILFPMFLVLLWKIHLYNLFGQTDSSEKGWCLYIKGSISCFTHLK